MNSISEPIPVGPESSMLVEGNTATGDVTIKFAHGNTVTVETIGWAAARRLSGALEEATDAITDQGERDLDADLAKHPHVSARWLGEMGREQRSN